MNTSKHHRRWLVVMACLVWVLPILAAPPTAKSRPVKDSVSVTSAEPAEVEQGVESDVIVNGSGFDESSVVTYLVTNTTDASQVVVDSVKFIDATQLVTHIRVKIDALPAEYDIEVQTASGRKGKGTTLFQVRQGGQPQDPPPPSYPPARFWHSFTSNDSTAPETSRLYMFGGNGAYQLDWQDLSDLWAFSVADSQWTLRAWSSSTRPGPRHHTGFSCGAGRCVLANGSGFQSLKETWVYTEESDSWAQVNCKRFLCPSARMMPAMTFDPQRNYHLLFGGGSSSTSLADTYTFSNTTQRWTLQNPKSAPSARSWGAATFVAGPVNRVVLFGGMDNYTGIFCDMWSWTGSTWEEIGQNNSGPCLTNHSMAWDGERLILTGGAEDMNDTPNNSVWTFVFDPGGASGSWSEDPNWYQNALCEDGIHPQAHMAYDRPSGVMVFFGGGENTPEYGAVAFDDTAVCQAAN